MQKITSYRDLQAWQLGMDFTETVYALTRGAVFLGLTPGELEQRTVEWELRTRERHQSSNLRTQRSPKPEARIPVT
jgi:hypothetical protein